MAGGRSVALQGAPRALNEARLPVGLRKPRVPLRHFASLAFTRCESLPPATMPKIRTTRTKKPPEGFEDIESVRTGSHLVPLVTAASGGTVKRAGMR